MKLHLVLVRSEYPSNIGSAARALANMGGDRLILIDAQCDPTYKTRQMAAGAQSKLQDLVQYKSWEEFYAAEGEGLRIALTRRGGQQRRVTPLKEELARIENAPEHLYLILGPEADGLSAEDMAHANHACHLPIFGEFGSLNLAQAAMLGLYLVRDKFPPSELPAQLTSATATAVQPFYFPDVSIREWLTAIGFDVNARRASAFLTLRKLFLSHQPTRHEIHVLEAVLQQNIRKLRGENPAVPIQD